MDKLQTGLVLGGILLIQILYFGFDTVQLNKEGEVTPEEASATLSLDMNIALEEAMSALDSENRDSVSLWTERAETGDILSLKQLSSFWVSKDEWLLAGHYTEQIADIQPTAENFSIAANTYATGAEMAQNEDSGFAMSRRAEVMYDKAIDEQGGNFNLELQKSLLMIKFPDAENPMKGVLALVDLSEKYPDEPRVFRELGEFSMQTGQWDRAQERLEKAYSLDPDHKKTICLLSDVYAETGEQKKSEEFRILCEGN